MKEEDLTVVIVVSATIAVIAFLFVLLAIFACVTSTERWRLFTVFTGRGWTSLVVSTAIEDEILSIATYDTP